MDNLKCEDCGVECESVTQTTCPFAAEIHDTEQEITVCNDCYHERLMAI